MQTKNRVYDKDLRRFIYPQPFNFKRETTNQSKIPRYLSVSPIDDPQSKKNKLHFQYTPSKYFPNREMNRNALGYPRDEGQFSIWGNKSNNYPFSYTNNTYKPEGKIYHYSIASKREYNQGKEEDTSSGTQKVNITDNITPKLHLDNKTYMIESNNRYKQFLNRRKEENILPTKVFISDTYQYNKNYPYKFRPSREKDGYKGGVINLNQNNNYTTEEALKKIILIQKWWKKYSNKNRTSYERYNSIVNRQSFSRNDTNNNNKGNKFIVQTTRVEVFKRPYMSIPMIKPEIITKENKINFDRKNDEDNLEIILDKESLKQNMVNIWNEENILQLSDSLCILQDNNYNYNKENILRGNKIKKYEDEIMQLKLALEFKEKELNELSNKLKNIQNKQALNKKLMRRQLVDNLFINDNRNISIQQNSSIESNDNFEILPLEKNPLQKQIIDSLFVPNSSKNYPTIFTDDKTITEARDNLEILPIEKEPLKKQIVDILFIEKTDLIKPENIVQNVDKLAISKISKEENSIESVETIEIIPSQKEPLQIQFIDALYIEKQDKIKPENKIQKIEKISLYKIKKPENKYENIDKIEISYIKEEKILEKQSVDNLLIEKIMPLNSIQIVDEFSIIKTKKPDNIIEAQYYYELLPKEKEPLKKQSVDDLYIEKTPYIPSFKNLIIEEFEGISLILQEKEELFLQAVDSILIDSLERKENQKQQIDLMTILETPKPMNSIEISGTIFLPPKEKSPLEIQLIDRLLIETNKRPENKQQNIDKLQLDSLAKPTHVIEQLDFINLLQKENESLINQEIDSIIIEPLNKPEVKTQSIDQLTLLKEEKPELFIEEKDSIFIPQKEKALLDINSIDGLLIVGESRPINELQNIDKINLKPKEKPKIEMSEKMELFIPLKEKEELLNENIDNIFIEQIQKKENLIQNLDKFNLEEKKRPENIIQENDYLFIPKKEKIPHENQSIDSIIIEPKERAENEIQPMHKINLDELNKPENIIQNTEDLFIPSEEKPPHEFQSVDNLLIEGYEHEDIYLLQKIDEFTILKNFKLSYRIDKMDTIFIPRKIKPPLMSQTVDGIYITGDSIQYDDNKIQEMDKIIILKKQKEENKIQKGDNFVLLYKKKNVLLVQKLDSLTIEKESKEKFENIIENNEEIFIPQKVKEKKELSTKLVESISLERIKYPENLAQIIDKLEISGFTKPINQIEEKESICIPQIQKPEIKLENIDKIQISLEKPILKEMQINNQDNINLLEINKPENIIEYLDSLLIKPVTKKELNFQKCDELPFEGINREENEIQKVEFIEILKTEKSFIQEIELIESLYLPSKPKDQLKSENIDNISFKEITKQENQIQLSDEFNIIKSPINKSLNYHKEPILDFLIEPTFIPLEIQLIDKLIIDGITQPENELQKLETIEITPITQEKQFKNVITNSFLLEDNKQKSENNIEKNNNFAIKPKPKKPLEYQRVESVIVNAGINIDYKIQKAYEMEVKKEIKKMKPKINEIDKSINFYIQSQQKGILEYQVLDRMLIEGILMPENEIQQAQKFTIEKSYKIKDKIIFILENDIHFMIKSKEKEPLQKQITDSIFMEKIKKEENIVVTGEKFVILKMPKEEKEKGENVLEKSCNLLIEPKKKKEQRELEFQNIDSLYIERLMPSFQAQKSIKETKESFTISKSKQEKKEIPLSINKFEEFIKGSILPCKKTAENIIDKREEFNIKPIDINEEYIVELINKKNMDEKKFNLHSKSKEKEIKLPPEKEKIEFVKDRMDSLFFSGKEIEKISEKEIIKEEKIEEKIEVKKEEIKPKEKIFENLIQNKENELFINKEEKQVFPEIKINQEKSSLTQPEELTQEKIYNIFLDKWKKEKIKVQEIIKFKIEGLKIKMLPIITKIPTKKEEDKQIKSFNYISAKTANLNLDGNISPESYNELILLKKKYNEQKDKILPQSGVNIYLAKSTKPLEATIKSQDSEIKSSEKKPVINLIASKSESFNLTGNITQEYYIELISMSSKYNKYLTKKDQIQIGGKETIYLSAIPSPKIIPQNIDTTKISFWIKGKQRKPFIIENKGYFIINSQPSSSNNLIVRGTCFGFEAKPNKSGLVSQDFGIIQDKENSKQNWNILNKQQRSQFFIIKGNDNKISWNKIIKRQKCVKFNIPPEKIINIDLLSQEKINNIIIFGNKSFEQEINREDYNYNSLEKDINLKNEKQKRPVKSTISRIYKEPVLEDSQEEFDPFSCCKKRDTTKYDKLFQERKTASALMKENNDINTNIISPDKTRITENIRKVKGIEIKIKEKNERKSDSNLLEYKNRNKRKLMNKDNNGYFGQNTFKKEAKKIEYLRDYEYDDQYYN